METIEYLAMLKKILTTLKDGVDRAKRQFIAKKYLLLAQDFYLHAYEMAEEEMLSCLDVMQEIVCLLEDDLMHAHDALAGLRIFDPR